MKRTLALSLVLVAALSGCELGNSSSSSTDATDPAGGGGGSAPVATPAPTCVAGGGFNAPNGVYIYAGTTGSTFQTLNLYFQAATGANSTAQSVTVTAYQCGFGGTQLGTKTITTPTLFTTTYTQATFNFSSPITIPTCSGNVGIVALKIDTADTSHNVYIGAQNSAGSCTMKISTDSSSTPPAMQSIWYAAGSYN